METCSPRLLRRSIARVRGTVRILSGRRRVIRSRCSRHTRRPPSPEPNLDRIKSLSLTTGKSRCTRGNQPGSVTYVRSQSLQFVLVWFLHRAASAAITSSARGYETSRRHQASDQIVYLKFDLYAVIALHNHGGFFDLRTLLDQPARGLFVVWRGHVYFLS